MPNCAYKRVIQIELNELSYDIVGRLVSRQQLPNFAKILDRWAYVETDSEAEYRNIEPWIQWVTVHTGKRYSDHGIFRLGDATELRHPQIWEVLSEHGIESAIVGSMNCTRGDSKGGLFFPDPWSKSASIYPEDLKPLWDIVSNRVQGHAVSQPSSSDALKALSALQRFSIPKQLYFRIARQLICQRFDPKTKWRLAILFDELLAYIFMSVLQHPHYQFCTLFLNAIAHYQHHYWRNFDHSIFDQSITTPDCRDNDNPISEGYRVYDRILGSIMDRFHTEDTLIVILSGLSQVPYLQKEAEGGMNYYRLKDHSSFAIKLGLGKLDVYPMMSRDWQVHSDDKDYLDHCRQVLQSITVENIRVFDVNQSIDRHLFLETGITKLVNENSEIFLGDKPIGKFYDYFVRIAVKSGHHVSKGSLWISDQKSLPSFHQNKQRIPLEQTFQLCLDAFNIGKNLQTSAGS